MWNVLGHWRWTQMASMNMRWLLQIHPGHFWSIKRHMKIQYSSDPTISNLHYNLYEEQTQTKRAMGRVRLHCTSDLVALRDTDGDKARSTGSLAYLLHQHLESIGIPYCSSSLLFLCLLCHHPWHYYCWDSSISAIDQLLTFDRFISGLWSALWGVGSEGSSLCFYFSTSWPCSPTLMLLDMIWSRAGALSSSQVRVSRWWYLFGRWPFSSRQHLLFELDEMRFGMTYGQHVGKEDSVC